MSLVLGLETSCDETAAAVVADQVRVLSAVTYTQTVHARYGGVVPELASREHLGRLPALVRHALREARVTPADLDGIAVTRGPGLIGCLLVGVSYAKGLAAASGKCLVGVNHLEGHAVSNRLTQPDFPLPHVVLIVSGGHTSLVLVDTWGEFTMLGQTLDDAAGEALDKIGKLVGLAYPAGAEIDRLAKEGNPTAISFPRARLEEGSLAFSFSGVKTAAAVRLERDPHLGRPEHLPDFLASFQEAIVDVLVEKLTAAAKSTSARGIALAGGVACNSVLRRKADLAAERLGLAFAVPSPAYCTDNAAMIAARGAIDLDRGIHSPPDLTAVPDWMIGEAP